MVVKKKGSGKSAKLKLKKETLKDLDARGRVKGGAMVAMTATCAGCQQMDKTTNPPVYPVLQSAGCGIKGRG